VAGRVAEKTVIADELSREDFIWTLGTLCALHRIPFEPALFLGQFPPPYTVEKLLAALGALGFHAGQTDARSVDPQATPFPCVAFRRGNGSDKELKAAILAGGDAAGVVIFDASSREPQNLDLARFNESFEPLILLLRRDTPAVADEPDARPQAFGFKWFIPELLRHKRIWREVLLASLAIQLVGLATPLFTQVVIDKVVVHQTQSTLWVVGLGLAMFMVFGAAMSWMRQAI